MAHVTVVAGAQYGSEAKGATVAHLARDFDDRDVVIRVAGPNAGHTAYDDQGREWKLRAVPVAAVVSPTCRLMLAAGSEIDLEVLSFEMAQLESAGHKIMDRLTIHPSATILEPRHLAAEAATGIVGRIGSTGKGIGAARAERILRNASTWGEYTKSEGARSLTGEPGPLRPKLYRNIVIEGTQGYGLGLHTSNYPQVTSSDCRAVDFLAMAGISPWDMGVTKLKVLLVARCFPIRVAGNSGPLKNETTWGELGLPDERTTVTNKIRRVGGWDLDLVKEAVAANGGGGWNSSVKLVLTMLDQKFPEVKGATDEDGLSRDAVDWIRDVQDDLETDVFAVGTSPTTMFEVAL